jgi:hypothetical protein
LVTVKVEVVIVAGFMALLNVAVMTAVLGQTVEASGGVTDVTAGGVKGAPGFVDVAVLSLSLQPTRTTTERNAAMQRFRTCDLYIRLSSLLDTGVPHFTDAGNN